MKPSDRFKNPSGINAAGFHPNRPTGLPTPAEIQTEINTALDKVVEEPTTLSRKAYNFVYNAEFTGELRNKITMLGRDSFEKILPFLTNEQICKALEMEMDTTSEENIPTETQGILVFASAIGIDKDYIFTLYKEYLKSFMR